MYIQFSTLFFTIQLLFACQSLNKVDTPSGSAAKSPLVTEAAAPRSMYQSMDHGRTWNDFSDGVPGFLENSRVFLNGFDVYMSSEKGLYVSPAPKVAVWDKEYFFGKYISNVYPGKSGPYATSYGTGFFQKVDFLGLWVSLNENLEDKSIHSLVETKDGGILIACDSGIYKSSDRGKSWNKVFSKGMVSTLSQQGDVIVAGGYAGLLRSTDGGATWEWTHTKNGSVLRLVSIDQGYLALVQGYSPWSANDTDRQNNDNKLLISEDEGRTWKNFNGPEASSKFTYDIEFDGAYLFCSNEMGVHRSKDLGKTWELVIAAKDKQTFELTVSKQMVFAVPFSGC